MLPGQLCDQRCSAIFIIHGKCDKTVPFTQGVELHDELEKAGCDVTLLEIEDADHADIRFFQKEIWQEIIAFFKMKFDVLDERKQVGKTCDHDI